MSASRQKKVATAAAPAPGPQRDSQAYYPFARKAQILEQIGEFTHASEAWKKANRVSHNQINQNWSEQRAEFCVKQNARQISLRRMAENEPATS